MFCPKSSRCPLLGRLMWHLGSGPLGFADGFESSFACRPRAAKVPKYIHEKHFVPVPEASLPEYHSVPVKLTDPGQAGWRFLWINLRVVILSSKHTVIDHIHHRSRFMSLLGLVMRPLLRMKGHHSALADAASDQCEEQGRTRRSKLQPWCETDSFGNSVLSDSHPLQLAFGSGDLQDEEPRWRLLAEQLARRGQCDFDAENAR